MHGKYKEVAMAWNGSNGVNARTMSPARKASGRIYAYALAAIALLALGVAWSVASNGRRGGDADAGERPVAQKARQIAEGKVEQHRQQAEHETVKTVKKVHPNEETYRDERGVLRRKIGNARVFDPSIPIIKIDPNYDKDGNPRYHSKFLIFKNPVDNEIARLISIKPGMATFGTRRYDAKFEERFREALTHPIEFSDEDSPYERALKESVAAVRKSLEERVANGERLSDIMNGAQKDLRRLSNYRRDLQQQLKEIAKDGQLTEQDVKDAVQAANIMLKSKGASPVSEGAFLNAHLRMQYQEVN